MANGLYNILTSVRKGSRAVDLRKMSGEDAMEKLDQILVEAVAAQASGSSKMMKNSIQELKQTRKALIAKQINVGKEAESRYVATIGGVLDQMNANEQIMGRQLSKTSSSISDSLPSSDSIISAVMTANPLIGYGAKLIKDIGGNVRDRVKESQLENEERLQMLEEQKKAILSQVRAAETSEDASDKIVQSSNIYQKMIDNIDKQLKMIVDDMALQNRILSNIDNNTYELATEFGAEIQRDIEYTNQLIERQNTVQKENELRRIETQRETKPTGKLERVKTDEMDQYSSMLEDSVLLSSFTSLMAPITGILTALVTFGFKVIKLGAVAVAFKGIYDFVDGFMNASDIIGKEESQISIKDRVFAGASKLVSGVLKLFDSITNMIGIDVIDTEGNLTKRIYESIVEVENLFTSMLDNILGDFKKIVDAYKNDGLLAAGKVALDITTDRAKTVATNVEYLGKGVAESLGFDVGYSSGIVNMDEVKKARMEARNRRELSENKARMEAVDQINNQNINNNVVNAPNQPMQQDSPKVSIPTSSDNKESDLRYVNMDIMSNLIR